MTKPIPDRVRITPEAMQVIDRAPKYISVRFLIGHLLGFPGAGITPYAGKATTIGPHKKTQAISDRIVAAIRALEQVTLETDQEETSTFAVIYCSEFPLELKPHILYVAKPLATVGHKCPCGCGDDVFVPTGPKGWRLIAADRIVSLYPAVQNRGKCQSRYSVENNRVRWEPATVAAEA